MAFQKVPNNLKFNKRTNMLNGNFKGIGTGRNRLMRMFKKTITFSLCNN